MAETWKETIERLFDRGELRREPGGWFLDFDYRGLRMTVYGKTRREAVSYANRKILDMDRHQ